MSTEADRDKLFSLLISSTFDNFGFRRDAISVRTKFHDILYETFSKCFSRCGLPVTVTAVGSTGEGVGLQSSDLDCMLVFNDTICVDTAVYQRHFNILETDFSDTPPGYTKLLSVHCCEDWWIGMLFSQSNIYKFRSEFPYVSSADFRKVCNYMNEILVGYADISLSQSETNGPAVSRRVTGTDDDAALDTDVVPSLYFYGGKDICKWVTRTRFHQWPSVDTIKEVSVMEGYVVPVGMKESENVNIEWRVCYTTAEKKLVRSFNDIQMKLYILLKLIAKHLKKECKPFTSYIVKNVVFWICEGNPHSQFSPFLLLNLVEKSLCFVKLCLQNNFLPNYMIPGRNLLTGSFSVQDKQNLIKLISDVLGTSSLDFILKTDIRLQKCISYLYMCPRFIVLYGQWRDKAERLWNTNSQQKFEHLDIDMFTSISVAADLNTKYATKDARCFETIMELIDHVVPDWCFLSVTGRPDEAWNRCNHRTNLFLRRWF